MTAPALPDLRSATVSDIDGKIRLAFADRLPTDTYTLLRNAGFQWWPAQKLLVANYNPYREDVVWQLYPNVVFEAAEDLDEYRESAAARVERFKGYADHAAQTASALTSRTAYRWDQIDQLVAADDKATYWQRRAEAALKQQQKRERPAPIFRRIKTLEADKRKAERDRDHPNATHSQRATARRWITFYDRRLAFENALYLASGGIPAEQGTPLEVGGAITYWDGTAEILKVNKKSVTVKTPYTYTRNVALDDIKAVLSKAEWHVRHPEAANKPTLTFVVGGGIEVESRQGCVRYEIVSFARGKVTIKEGRGTRTYKQIVVKRTFSPDEWQTLQAGSLAAAS